MSRLFITSFLALSCSLSASAATSARVSDSEKVRKAIDDICGDTWCEGDFQYQFNSVDLNKKSGESTVTFMMSPYSSEENVTTNETFVSSIDQTRFSVKCVVKGYADAALIVRDDGSLDEGFYKALSSCINSLEDKLVSRL